MLHVGLRGSDAVLLLVLILRLCDHLLLGHLAILTLGVFLSELQLLLLLISLVILLLVVLVKLLIYLKLWLLWYI